MPGEDIRVDRGGAEALVPQEEGGAGGGHGDWTAGRVCAGEGGERRRINSLDGLMGLPLYKFLWADGPNVDGSDREFKRINIRMLYSFREADD
jgi:hypothetical protein